GYYQVIHFDAHGALLSSDEYQKVQQIPQASSYVYNARYGREDIAPYEGVKAFLPLRVTKRASQTCSRPQNSPICSSITASPLSCSTPVNLASRSERARRAWAAA